MATMVGNEKDTLSLFHSLAELDYDAIEAYDAAIERVDSAMDRQMLSQFRADHLRHVSELSGAIRQMGGTPPTQGDIKRVLTKGKVVLMGLAGDRAVLQAMKSNEEDTNTAYERAVVRNIPSHYLAIVERGLDDERKHRAWLVQRIRTFEDVATI